MSVIPTPSQISKRVARVREAFHQAAFAPIARRQEASARDAPASGPLWISRATHPSPSEDSLLKVVGDAIRELGDGTESFELPSIGVLETQWLGWRSGVGKDEPEPHISEPEKYSCMMKEVESDLVVLYAYGGAFMLGGPTSARPVCTQLAHLTKGRCYIPKYRLAPQNPFPTAIIDILHAYLTLISPPPGSSHAPIAPSSIVFAGDSAGACLVLAVINILLSFSRTKSGQDSDFKFHGQAVNLRPPAGVAIVCLNADNVLATPSWTHNAASDIFDDEAPSTTPGFPCDSAWPSSPPRANIYAEAPTLLHPLVSLCTTPARCWKGAPPLWIAMGGGERLLDSAKIVARDIASEGGIVRWNELEKMPHGFTAFQDWWQARRTIKMWAAACLAIVKGSMKMSEGVILRVDQSEERVDVSTLTDLARNDVLRAMKNRVAKLQVWTGSSGGSSRAKI